MRHKVAKAKCCDFTLARSCAAIDSADRWDFCPIDAAVDSGISTGSSARHRWTVSNGFILSRGEHAMHHWSARKFRFAQGKIQAAVRTSLERPGQASEGPSTHRIGERRNPARAHCAGFGRRRFWVCLAGKSRMYRWQADHVVDGLLVAASGPLSSDRRGQLGDPLWSTGGIAPAVGTYPPSASNIRSSPMVMRRGSSVVLAMREGAGCCREGADSGRQASPRFGILIPLLPFTRR